MLRSTRRFTVDEFTRMAEAGIFGENECIELIDGEVIRLAAQRESSSSPMSSDSRYL